MKHILSWVRNTVAMWSFVTKINNKIIWILTLPMVAQIAIPVFMGIAITPASQAFQTGDAEKLQPLLPYIAIGGLIWLLVRVFEVPIRKVVQRHNLEHQRLVSLQLYRLSYWIPFHWSIDKVQSERFGRFDSYYKELTQHMRKQLSVIPSLVKTVVGLYLGATFHPAVLVGLLMVAIIAAIFEFKTKKKTFEHANDSQQYQLWWRLSTLEDILRFPSNIQVHLTNTFAGMSSLFMKTGQKADERSLEREVMFFKHYRRDNLIKAGVKAFIVGWFVYQIAGETNLYDLDEKILTAGAVLMPLYFMAMYIYSGLGSIFSTLVEQAITSKNIDLVFDVLREARDNENQDVLKQEVNVNGGLVVDFRQVTFGYKPEEGNVFEDLSLSLDLGQLNALCGENGGGKTTLMMMLRGFLEPQYGEVLLNDVPIKNIKRRWLVANFAGYSPRMLIPRGLEVKELLDPLGCTDSETLWSILDDVGLGDRLRKNQLGLDVVIGSSFVNGSDFSEGQLQRLMIARMLVQCVQGAKFILADETTANIAPEDQAELIGIFRKYATGGLLIAHNPIANEACDVRLRCTRGEFTLEGLPA